jgi:putative ABC transport system ATP-binding protein
VVAAVLKAEEIRKKYVDAAEEVDVLKGVSLALGPGEVVALEGPSGSGKTTLLSILGCLLTPTSGRVVILGGAVDQGRPDLLWKHRRDSIGFVFQQFNLFPSLTAAENVEYALNVKGRTGREARREAERWLGEVGLSDRLRFRPRDLSGGQKQRVAVARALAGGAPIILADEPTGNLDLQAGEHVLDLFRDLARREGRALLVVTHDPKVRRIADRVVSIHDGRLLEQGEGA